MNYVVGDFIIQLKNAALSRKRELMIPYASINKAISAVLRKEGFVEEAKEAIVDGKRMLAVTLRYQRRKPTLTDVKLISKPSLRVYIASSDVGKNQNRSITSVLSTNQGILTGKEARQKGVGGELLFLVW